jgi:EAL domain-containing protein (putative c-di-GMP-specific phosphodiesterase class I)
MLGRTERERAMVPETGDETLDAEPGQDSPLAVAMEAQSADALAMVRAAVARRRVLLAFQPVVRSARPREVAFHEGLIRVLDETGRIIPARDFIGAVETSELGRVLDSLALEIGLATLADQPGLRLAINMSARSIGYPRWTETLRRGLAEDPTAGERLILEITEASAMVMPDITVHFMRSLRREGISFALDDFGSGYTSFRYLREFFFDAVKIDGQFVRRIESDPDNQCLTRALVTIAEHFDMFTVAEAVETAEEAACLAALGVDCQQGYFHGAPTTRPAWVAESRRSA